MIRMNEGTPGNIEGGELDAYYRKSLSASGKREISENRNKVRELRICLVFRRLLSVCTWWSFYMDASVYHCYERA